jgi:hypothetical protein
VNVIIKFTMVLEIQPIPPGMIQKLQRCIARSAMKFGIGLITFQRIGTFERLYGKQKIPEAQTPGSFIYQRDCVKISNASLYGGGR